MSAPNPEDEEQELAEQDRLTVMNCDHEAIEAITSANTPSHRPAKYKYGPVYIDIIECVACPSRVVLILADDPRDDMYANLPLGN